MGRREYYEEQKLKKLVYVFASVLAVSIVVFLTIFVMYNKKLKEDSAKSLLELGKMNDIVSNDELEETSFTSDSTVSNMTNSSNTSTEKNETTSNNTKKEKVNTTPVNSIIDNTVATSQNVSNNENTIGNEVNTNQVNADNQKAELEFTAPVSGEIMKDFAKDTLVYSNTLEEWTIHNGIDIKADKMSVVTASEAGTVESIKNDPRYGLTITISHQDGFKTIYSNLLTTEFVKESEVVEKGQTIGTIGDSASFEVADEPHLHFEMYKDGENVNPTLYLK